jgi:hypothetical protein
MIHFVATARFTGSEWFPVGVTIGAASNGFFTDRVFEDRGNAVGVGFGEVGDGFWASWGEASAVVRGLESFWGGVAATREVVFG